MEDPLQHVIQLLKRHRDVMFQDNPDGKPISMIITTLATHSYSDEHNLYDSLANVVKHMGDYIRQTWPRVPNPVNPKEDFADAWRENQRLEDNFWAWHTQLQRDVDRLADQMNRSQLDHFVYQNFSLNLNDQQANQLAHDDADARRPSSATIKTPPKSWASRAI